VSVADSEIKGRLLIASPVLGDPNFHRTVVFMIEHTAAAGALGVVLNRPSEQRVSEAVPGWEGLAAAPGVVFSGGPVEGGRVLCLGRSKPGPDRAVEDALEEPTAGPSDGPSSDTPGGAWTPVLGRIGMVDLSQDPAVVRRRVDLVRLFSGYAGWGAGQLEGELQEGAWFVLEATEADALTPQPEDLWQQVFRRQPDDLKWMGFFPDDPQQN